jgi:hypothetical protein
MSYTFSRSDCVGRQMLSQSLSRLYVTPRLFKRVDNISGTLRFDFSRDIFATLRKHPPVIVFLTASMRATRRLCLQATRMVGSDSVGGSRSV